MGNSTLTFLLITLITVVLTDRLAAFPFPLGAPLILLVDIDRQTVCNSDFSLKSLWFLSRQVSHHYRFPFPPPFKAVKAYVDKRPSVLMTRQIAKYLGFGHVAGRTEGAYWTFDAILVCAKDPKYLPKMAKMIQSLDYEPSYRWQPDARTLAYCPFCRLAVLLDGKLEKR